MKPTKMIGHRPHGRRGDVRQWGAWLSSLAVLFLTLSWTFLAPTAHAAPVTETIEANGHKITYTITGVETDSDDKPGRRSGKVTAKSVTLTGEATFAIGEGYVTNLSMNASLSAGGGESDSASWPPAGTSGRVGGTTVTFPFTLTIPIPVAPPEKTDTVPMPGQTPTPGSTPYTSVSFRVSSTNCNDWGVCGGASANGSFDVYRASGGLTTFDWVTTAGALGATAAVIAAGVVAGRTKKSDNEPEHWRFVLQVANDKVVVEPGQPAAIDAQVWAVNSSGVAMPAAGAVLNATVAGPFRLSGSGGMQTLHLDVTTDALPGATGSVQLTASAGTLRMGTTVALIAQGGLQLQLAPVGEPMIRATPETGQYNPAFVDVRLVGGQPPTAIGLTLTTVELAPDQLVRARSMPVPGGSPGVRLQLDLAVDPQVLTDPANQRVQLTVTAVPADQASAPPAKGSLTVFLEPPGNLEMEFF